MEKLFSVKKTQIEMIRDRGYNVDAELPLLNYTVDEFIETYSEFVSTNKISFNTALNRVYYKSDDTKAPILVYYLQSNGGNTIGVAQIVDFIAYLKNLNILDVILITNVAIGHQALDRLRSIPILKITYFLESSLTYNPTKHFLVPKHVLYTEEETKKFYIENNIRPNQMPVIFNSDAINKYYGGVPGQIYYIERNVFANESLVEKTKFFRLVRPDPPIKKNKL